MEIGSQCDTQKKNQRCAQKIPSTVAVPPSKQPTSPAERAAMRIALQLQHSNRVPQTAPVRVHVDRVSVQGAFASGRGLIRESGLCRAVRHVLDEAGRAGRSAAWNSFSNWSPYCFAFFLPSDNSSSYRSSTRFSNPLKPCLV